jgi:uridylate kinase
LRGIEINADVILKEHVDGVYDCDPEKNESAEIRFYFEDVLKKRFKCNGHHSVYIEPRKQITDKFLI